LEALIDTRINTDLFQQLIDPVHHWLEDNKVAIGTDTAKILTFKLFLKLLLYFYLKGIDTLRSLITDLQTSPDSARAGLFPVGLSTIHDAFYRYSLQLFQAIYVDLLKRFSIAEIAEFKELGRLIVTDGSLFRLAINDFWAEYRTRVKALKLHLHFELNQMVTTCFWVTQAKQDDRRELAQHLEQAVTYIADRGYACFKFFYQIVEREAFFIIRSRKNLIYLVKQPLTVQLRDSVKQIFFQVTDELVIFKADQQQHPYRRISFRTRQTLFVLITNRLDLTTYQIIRLYAFRWQIELFFRYFKRTLNGIHLINHGHNGVSIQFYVILVVNLLLMRFKKYQQQQYLSKQTTTNKVNITNIDSVEHFLESLGSQIPSYSKIKKQEINVIRNALFRSVQLEFEFY
jgi:hypothetical protein